MAHSRTERGEAPMKIIVTGALGHSLGI
ncbi:MAG: hypothetical protein JWM38_2485, partial [Sphingomonas bacterium]|nr:hypothetical protein [Sphingomonas bacterium]